MPGPGSPYTNLDYQQVIKQAFNEATDRLRVDATFTGTIAVSLNPITDGVYISDGVDKLLVNADGSLNVNLISPIDVNIAASGGDSILSVGTEDGTLSGIQHVLKVTSDGTLKVQDDNINAKLNTLGQKTMAGSVPVTLASDQSGFPIKLQDGSGNSITSTLFNSKQSLDVRPNTGYSTGSNTSPSINSTSSIILAANVNRKNAYVFNQTGVSIYLKLGDIAVIGTGIRLANNSMYEINGSNLWTGSINAIKAGAGLLAVEVFEGT